MSNAESLPRQLAHITIRIECPLDSGQCSIGTGFFFAFKEEANGAMVPGIITNKHVLKGANKIILRFTAANSDNTPRIGSIHVFSIDDFATRWLPHPDPDVDLAVIPVGELLANEKASGSPLYFKTVGKSHIPLKDRLLQFSALEDIVLIGYPIGLWDSVNNMPIFRKGITATQPGLNYEGRHEFLIDAACFPGSSGSPVFRYRPALGLNSSGGIQITGDAPQLSLLGVLHAGPQQTVEGRLEVVTIPTQQTTVPVSRIPINLGFVIRSERILEFEPIIEKLLVST